MPRSAAPCCERDPGRAARIFCKAAILTGARAGELTSATRGQFDERTRTMTFTGKTGTRSVPLTDQALKLFARLAKSKPPGARLFMRDDGRPWAHSDWDELVGKRAQLAGLQGAVCLYSLRHSFITQAITDGLTTLDVARLCGAQEIRDADDRVPAPAGACSSPWNAAGPAGN